MVPSEKKLEISRRWAYTFVLHFKISHPNPIFRILLSHFVFMLTSLAFSHCQALHTWLLTDCEIEISNNIIYQTGMRDEGCFAAMQATVHVAN